MFKKRSIPVHRVVDGAHVTLYPEIPRWQEMFYAKKAALLGDSAPSISGLVAPHLFSSSSTLEQRAVQGSFHDSVHSAHSLALLGRPSLYERTLYKYACAGIFTIMGLSALASITDYQGGSPVKGAVQFFTILTGSLAAGFFRADSLTRHYASVPVEERHVSHLG
ncbi:MAG: hypothetical protein Q7R76_06700 [Candidatus Woesearchaeota archaeon]|nr:hypothetical protein [Candidatus Woesearchaeota archaeon]